mmetsp:Transcript_71780/g.233336  ORF Transcript_71780/g.233336 Transcript_71780/m.233336 type:complete len:87 (-) Transcript_71780:794-1054(-)
MATMVQFYLESDQGLARSAGNYKYAYDGDCNDDGNSDDNYDDDTDHRVLGSLVGSGHFHSCVLCIAGLGLLASLQVESKRHCASSD